MIALEVRADVVDLEELSGERILRVAAADRRRAEARIAEGSGPLVGRIDARIRPGLLVRDHGAVGRRVAAEAVAQPGPPVDFVAAPELKIDAGVPGRLDVGALRPGPVLVVTDVEIGLVVQEQAAEAVGVDPCHVGDVVAVLLQPRDRGVFGAEEIVLRAGIGSDAAARRDRPVVAERVGASGTLARCGAVAAVKVRATPAVIGLPGLVRGLEDDVAVAANRPAR